MKYFFNLTAILICLCSCSDSAIMVPEKEVVQSSEELRPGMQCIKFTSREEIRQVVSSLTNPVSRSLAFDTFHFSHSEDEFVSLVEANKREVIGSLTSEQLDTLIRDEDELEFCPSDSVIADIHFAMLLNANREIQVGDTIFKYVPNGVGFVMESDVESLANLEERTQDIEVTEENIGKPISFEGNLTFLPWDYKQHEFDDGDGIGTGGDGNGKPTLAESVESGIRLSNGIFIPKEKIRDVDYGSGGDGNWLHKTLTGLFGKNVVALNKFAKRRQLNLNFYDQNYIIYANIGTKLKMQKQVCGIWWNIKCDEMILGWESVVIGHKLPKPIDPMNFTHPDMPGASVSSEFQSFPYQRNRILFKIPYVNYNFTDRDLGRAYKGAFDYAKSQASEWLKNKLDENSDQATLAVTQEKSFYFIHGPYCVSKKHVRSMEQKFHTKWFASECLFTFSFGNNVKFKDIKFDLDDGVYIESGRVYGVLKYKGEWYAARITKLGEQRK